jgi:hypothetical protein
MPIREKGGRRIGRRHFESYDTGWGGEGEIGLSTSINGSYVKGETAEVPVFQSANF